MVTMKQQGFSLIELIVTIIILGVLAVVVAPRFSSSESYQEHSYRAQVISLIRAMQLRAMQQTNDICHVVEVSDDQILGSIENKPSCNNVNNLNITIPADENVSFSLDGGAGVIRFNTLGVPQDDCFGGCDITVSGIDTLTIRIESQGYIHAI